MNERARELLVAAALRGHRQITKVMHDTTRPEGECALGVLHLELHETRAEAVACRHSSSNTWRPCNERMCEAFGFSSDDSLWAVSCANDSGADFLTIARKFEEAGS